MEFESPGRLLSSPRHRNGDTMVFRPLVHQGQVASRLGFKLEYAHEDLPKEVWGAGKQRFSIRLVPFTARAQHAITKAAGYQADAVTGTRVFDKRDEKLWEVAEAVANDVIELARQTVG